MIKFQDLKETDIEIREELKQVASRIIDSGRYINGETVRGLERDLAASCGARYAIAVSNGLDALRLIFTGYMALGRLKPGDEVIIPANTFIASFLAVTSCGLTAVAADVSEEDFNLDLYRLPLTERTKAVLLVHLYGNPCWNRNRIDKLRERGILIVEDNAQAIGAEAGEEGLNGNRLTGNLADAAAISFYPAKNIGALGDAGAVLTSDPLLERAVRKLANYGSDEKYHHDLRGFNCRMDELQAAFLQIKLGKLAGTSAERRHKARLYDMLIKNPAITKPKIFADRSQVWHQYVIRSGKRDSLRKYLEDHGVATEIHYPVACHRQKCYESSDALKVYGDLPVAETLSSEVLSLPIANVSDEEIKYISDIINGFDYEK